MLTLKSHLIRRKTEWLAVLLEIRPGPRLIDFRIVSSWKIWELF